MTDKTLPTFSNFMRLAPFDLLKLFAIFLVIWGHCIMWFQNGECAYNPFFRIIYSFHMPLFMMISGFFSFSSMNLGIHAFILKKLRTLIYPCIIWGLSLFVIYETTGLINHKNEPLSLCVLFTDLYWLSDFWFLKSCFICYFIAYIGFHSKLKKKYWIPLSIIVSQGITTSFVSFMYPCFIIGLLLRLNNSLMKKIIENYMILLLLFILMLILWDNNAWENSHGIPSNIKDAEIIVWINLISFRIFRHIIGITGALSFIGLFLNFFSKQTNKLLRNNLCEYGRYTLEVYIMQSILIERILSNYIKLDFLNPFIFNIIIMPIFSIAILNICIIFSKATLKQRYLSLLLWGK